MGNGKLVCLKAGNGIFQFQFVFFHLCEFLVKRSAEETTSVPSANKKSSPEIVPASFSNAPAARTSTNSASPSQQAPAGVYALPSNEEILAAVAAAAQNSQQQLQEEPTALEEAVASSTMRKRGINYEYNPYLPASTVSDYGSDVPSGVWSDDYETAVPVSYGERDLQEIDDYVPDRRGWFYDYYKKLSLYLYYYLIQ